MIKKRKAWLLKRVDVLRSGKRNNYGRGEVGIVFLQTKERHRIFLNQVNL